MYLRRSSASTPTTRPASSERGGREPARRDRCCALSGEHCDIWTFERNQPRHHGGLNQSRCHKTPHSTLARHVSQQNGNYRETHRLASSAASASPWRARPYAAIAFALTQIGPRQFEYGRIASAFE